MDPVTAVAGAVSTIVDAVTFRRRSQRDKLPQWLSPADFQQRDYTSTILVVGAVVLLIVIVVLIARTKK